MSLVRQFTVYKHILRWWKSRLCIMFCEDDVPKGDRLTYTFTFVTPLHGRYWTNLHLEISDSTLRQEEASYIKKAALDVKKVEEQVAFYRRCSNFVYILDLTTGFNGLGKDNCKARGETSIFFLIWCYLYYRFDSIYIYIYIYCNLTAFAGFGQLLVTSATLFGKGTRTHAFLTWICSETTVFTESKTTSLQSGITITHPTRLRCAPFMTPITSAVNKA